MKVVKRLLIAAALWACGIPLNVALAQAEPGIYASLYFGNADSKGTPAVFSQAGFAGFGIMPTGPITPTLQDEKDSGYGFQVGYRFNRWLALEGGYVDLGETTFKASAPGVLLFDNSTDTFTQKLSSGIAGITVSALGIVPLSYRWETYGRAGILIGNNELRVRAADSMGGSGSFDISESATDSMLGVGVAFFLAEVYSIRAEFTRIMDAGDGISGENDIDLLSLGFTVRF
jgi:hypothetical protein